MSLRKSIHRFYLAIVSEKSIKLILAMVFLLFLALLLKNILIIFLMLAIAIISLLHNIFTRNMIGFELVTFSTVFCAMKFGAAAGIFVGVFAILIGMMLSRNVDEGIFLMMVGFAAIGFFASMFSISHIFAVGMVSVILYDIVVVGFYMLMGSNVVKSVSYAFTHIMLNYFIFMYLPQFFKF